MAMASLATTLSASHSLAGALLLSKPTATSRRSSASLLPVVVSASPDGSQAKGAALSRRQVAVSLTALSMALFSSRQAEARDIPIFGLKKAKKVAEEVVQEAKELVKEGEGKVAAVGGAIAGAVAEFPGVAGPNIPIGGEDGLSPALQAGVVAGAGAIGVLVASTVVNSLVSPAK